MSVKGKGVAAAFLHHNVSYDGPSCLIWPMSRNVNGYAQFGFEGETYWAHRFMCELVNGPPPTPEHEAAHSCGRGKDGCVHPKHLSWKTQSENALDSRSHGTQARNPRGPAGKLTAEQVAEILALKGKATQASIAARYGVSPPTIRDIFTGRSRSRPNSRRMLTPAEVARIRNMRGRPMQRIADELSVNVSAVWRVLKKNSYADF
jgi:hypothetical protein